VQKNVRCVFGRRTRLLARLASAAHGQGQQTDLWPVLLLLTVVHVNMRQIPDSVTARPHPYLSRAKPGAQLAPKTENLQASVSCFVSWYIVFPRSEKSVIFRITIRARRIDLSHDVIFNIYRVTFGRIDPFPPVFFFMDGLMCNLVSQYPLHGHLTKGPRFLGALPRIDGVGQTHEILLPALAERFTQRCHDENNFRF
jgi:hypothetical protein